MKIGCVLAAVILCQVTYAQNSAIVTAAEVRQHMDDKSKPIHIINFWATWCGPCVKELPYFDAVTAAGNPDVQVTLVSMDLDLDPDPEKVYRFIARKGVRSKVLLLKENDPSSWIDTIAPEWSGALPATIIINNKTGARKFIGRSLREGELEKYLDEIK